MNIFTDRKSLTTIITRTICLIVLGFCVWGVLGFHQGTSAQQTRQPFANPVQQRDSMISELQEIKALLREQNELLRTIANK